MTRQSRIVGRRIGGRVKGLCLFGTVLGAVALLPACEPAKVPQPVSIAASCRDYISSGTTATRSVTLHVAVSGPDSAKAGSTVTFPTLTVSGASPLSSNGDANGVEADAVVTGLGNLTPSSSNTLLHPSATAGGFANNMSTFKDPVPFKSATASVTGAPGTTATLSLSKIEFISWNLYPVGTDCTLTSPPVVWRIAITK